MVLAASNISSSSYATALSYTTEYFCIFIGFSACFFSYVFSFFFLAFCCLFVDHEGGNMINERKKVRGEKKKNQMKHHHVISICALLFSSCTILV